MARKSVRGSVAGPRLSVIKGDSRGSVARRSGVGGMERRARVSISDRTSFLQKSLLDSRSGVDNRLSVAHQRSGAMAESLIQEEKARMSLKQQRLSRVNRQSFVSRKSIFTSGLATVSEMDGNSILPKFDLADLVRD